MNTEELAENVCGLGFTDLSMKRGSCSVKTWCVASTSMAQYCINSCRGQQSPDYLSVLHDDCKSFGGPCNLNTFGLWLLTIWHGICHETLTWKLFLTSVMLPFTKVSLASFCSGGPPTYRAWTSARLLMLLIFTQSQEPICTQNHHVTLSFVYNKSKVTNLTKRSWHFEQTPPLILHVVAEIQWMMCTNHWALPFLSSFLNVLFDILKTPLFTQLIGHPQCALKPSQPRDGHVKAHGVHEACLRTL